MVCVSLLESSSTGWYSLISITSLLLYSRYNEVCRDCSSCDRVLEVMPIPCDCAYEESLGSKGFIKLSTRIEFINLKLAKFPVVLFCVCSIEKLGPVRRGQARYSSLHSQPSLSAWDAALPRGDVDRGRSELHSPGTAARNSARTTVSYSILCCTFRTT